jgi:hypothetical protein
MEPVSTVKDDTVRVEKVDMVSKMGGYTAPFTDEIKSEDTEAKSAVKDDTVRVEKVEMVSKIGGYAALLIDEVKKEEMEPVAKVEMISEAGGGYCCPLIVLRLEISRG